MIVGSRLIPGRVGADNLSIADVEADPEPEPGIEPGIEAELPKIPSSEEWIE